MLEEPETPTAPVFDPALLDQLRATLQASGTAAAVDKLIQHLRVSEDYQSLFYALLLKKRVELGLSPFTTGVGSNIPEPAQEAYEHAIREAGREVGQALLERRRFAQAWGFFRMLNEPEAMRAALEGFEPGPDDDVYAAIEIAWQQGVLPQKGFDWVLKHHGICSAITMVSGADFSTNLELRDYCIKQLIHSLHSQLRERLQVDLAGRTIATPADATVRQLVELHPNLAGEMGYHVDTSHLLSVVQMSLYLPAGPENELAQELCEYGRRLAPGLQGFNDAPFEESYVDYLAYLQVVAAAPIPPRQGNAEVLEAGLARFRAKAEREAKEGSSYASQVLVNLLVRVNRPIEALEAAKQFLLSEDERNLICPGVNELARKAGDYATLAEAALARQDTVGYLAAQIAAHSPP